MCLCVHVCVRLWVCMCVYACVHMCVVLPFYQGMVGMRCHSPSHRALATL